MVTYESNKVVTELLQKYDRGIKREEKTGLKKPVKI